MTARAVMNHVTSAGCDAAGGAAVGGDGGVIRGRVRYVDGGDCDGVVAGEELGEVGLECGGEGFGGEGFEVEGFGAAGGAGDERDAGAGDAEGFGEEGDERGVGAAVGGWGGEGDFQGAVMGAGDGVAAGAGMNADG